MDAMKNNRNGSGKFGWLVEKKECLSMVLTLNREVNEGVVFGFAFAIFP